MKRAKWHWRATGHIRAKLESSGENLAVQATPLNLTFLFFIIKNRMHIVIPL